MIRILVLLLLASPLRAEFTPVDSRTAFEALVDMRKLSRFGISLEVSPSGDIAGSAFNYDVSGSWSWQDRYFCRQLYWGGDDIGYNCQLVEVSGSRLRFTSDQGTGDSATFRIK